MCSRLGEDDNTEDPVRRLKSESNRSLKICVKCGENKAKVVTRVNDPFCRDCFLTYVTHKFRAVIGKSKLVRDGEKILLAYSGGPSSTTLLNLVKDGLEKTKFKKIRFVPEIVYIDEGAALGLSWAERQEILLQIKDFIEGVGLPYYLTSLEQVFQLPDHSVIAPAVLKNGEGEFVQDVKLEEKLQNLLNNIKSLTFKQQLLKHLRSDLLVGIARLTGNAKIMVGTNRNCLAIHMLADIALGRGAHVAMNSGFSDTRNEDIMTVRPIKDFTSKEVAMYNVVKGVRSVTSYSLSTMTSSGASIERLTEKFVTELHAEYPSTVCNITRTSEKLDVQLTRTTVSKCTLCKGWLDTAVDKASAIGALKISHDLSTARNNSQESQENDSADADISDQLCYGCCAMVSEMEKSDCLPHHMTQSKNQSDIRLFQKDSIREFLLEPSPEDTSGNEAES